MTKVKIPKRVAGVKIPKKTRRKANKALKMADSPVVRGFAAAALGAAAKAKAKASKPSIRIDGETIDGDKLAEAIRSAALDGIRRFLEGFEEGLRNAAADNDDGREPDSRRSGPRPV